MDERQRIREGRLMPPPSRRLNDKSLNQILTASKSSLVTAGEISNKIMKEDVLNAMWRMKITFLRRWYRLRALKSLAKFYVWSKTLKEMEDRELAIKYYQSMHAMLGRIYVAQLKRT